MPLKRIVLNFVPEFWNIRANWYLEPYRGGGNIAQRVSAEVILAKTTEKSRHVGGQPRTLDQAENRKKQKANQDIPSRKTGSSAKPKNSDVEIF